MTNASINYVLNTYGTKVFSAVFNNNLTILLGYNGHTKYEDIEVTTNLTDEVVLVHTSVNFNGKEIHYTIYHGSETLQYIGVMDDDCADYRPDPILC